MTQWLRNFLLMVMMLAAATISLALAPRPTLAGTAPKTDLENTIPRQFGEWKEDKSVVPIQVSPDVQERLDAIYSQTLSRTYANGSGARLMLSIAYGQQQTRTLQIHRPEVCYTVQGFLIKDSTKGSLVAPNQLNIPVMRLIAVQGDRSEPITYWVRFGRDLVRGNLEQGISRLRHGLRGEISDGLLFRVSNISTDIENSYLLQERFVRELLEYSTPETKEMLIGSR